MGLTTQYLMRWYWRNACGQMLSLIGVVHSGSGVHILIANQAQIFAY